MSMNEERPKERRDGRQEARRDGRQDGRHAGLPEAGHELADELRELGRRMRSPDVDGPTMAERVLAQIVAEAVAVPVARPPARGERLRAWARRRWRAVAAALSGLLVVLVLTPPVRAAVADWFGFGGVDVRYDPTASPPPGPPGAGAPDCRGGLTVAEAALRAGFDPVLPRGLGKPVAASVSRDRRVLSVCWRTEGGRTVRIDEFRAAIDPVFYKATPVPAEYTEVDGRTALWFPERHRLTLRLVDEDGRPYARKVRSAGPTLVWQRAGDLTLRLEGVTSMERAVDLAETASKSAGESAD
ncbi:hypothetical protein [Streptomyces spiramyceticus]|uniref:hypothetical protein n=1 Tax=Streptomyces spiramyceticus TaxID=299717 RepID=UPI00237AD4C5|nr:hypothetical protein [Streptomyces spiramyceticus]